MTEACSIIENGRRCTEPVQRVIEGCGCGDPDCVNEIRLCERHGKEIGFIP